MPDLSRRDWLRSTASTALTLASTGLVAQALRAQPAATVPADNSAAVPPEQLVDVHLHIQHRERSLEQTIQHMDATGTSQAFILPLEIFEGNVLLHSETVLHARHLYPKRVIPFCQTDLTRPDALEKLRAYHLLGCRGVGEQKQQMPFGDKRVEAVIALCDELDWPITFHFQDGPNGYNTGMADHLERYLKTYPRVRIIGHAQTFWANISSEVPPAEKSLYPKGKVAPGGLLDRLLSDYPNLYADLSAGSGYTAISRDEEFTAGFIERHPRQLLFGSDCPCRDGRGESFQGQCYSTQLRQFLHRMVTDQEVRSDIFRNNALRVLGG